MVIFSLRFEEGNGTGNITKYGQIYITACLDHCMERVWCDLLHVILKQAC